MKGYGIVQANVVFQNHAIQKVTVLIKDKDSYKAYTASKKVMSGYENINAGEQLSYHLLQNVAAFGLELHDIESEFPNLKP